ncbi:MAG: leucine-rich repeat protein, partial [Clostridia bacterium]|nr:leucine-rich repeat protein [Clostridia bacterium]
MGKTKTFSKKAVSIVIAMLMMVVVATLAFSGTIASAETSGDFTYTVSGSNATITGYSGSATNLVIPSKLNGNNVVKINARTFEGNNNIVSVTIPASVNVIGGSYNDGAFQDCKNLKTVTFAEGSTDAFIEQYAFINCLSLESVSLPGNYSSIGTRAFQGCSSMKSFEWKKSSYSFANQSISDNAFHGCSSLSTLSLPTTLKSIAASAFRSCNSLVNVVIPEGVTSIANGTFWGCSKLANVTLPSTLKTIGGSYNDGAFQDCKNLRTVSFAEGSSDASIEQYAFINCLSLEGVSLPGNYTYIGTRAFQGCISIEIFEWKKSSSSEANQSIGDNAFNGCSNLSTLSLPTTLKSIGASAFRSCTFLTKVFIPEGVINIDRGAFWGCAKLSEVTLPSTLKTIGGSYNDGAFQDCKRLKTVTFAEGSSDATIEQYAFINCTELENIIIPGNYTFIGTRAFQGCSAMKSFEWKKSTSSYANQSIGDNAFNSCSSLSSLSLPTTLKSIAASAFRSCNSLVSVIIPEGVTNIDRGAFWGCSNLTDVSLPSTLTVVGGAYNDGAFQDCKKLKTVTFAEGSSDAIIEQYAFINCIELAKVTIPCNYTHIGTRAFQGCTSLKSVEWKKSSYSYANQSIGDNAFHGCSSLVRLSLPTTLKSIAASAFRSCTSLEIVIIPESVESIANGTFWGCSKLTTVSLPSTLKVIEGSYNDGAFQNCHSLTTVIFAEGDRDLSIGRYTFNTCESLTIVHLPLNLISIDRNCFDASKTNLIICAKSIDSYAKTYADENGIPFTICGGGHETPDIPDAPDTPDVPDTPVVTTYTLSYDANGGSGAPAAQTGASEYTISTVAPVKDGYKFL